MTLKQRIASPQVQGLINEITAREETVAKNEATISLLRKENATISEKIESMKHTLRIELNIVE